MKFTLQIFLYLCVSTFILQSQDFHEGPYGVEYFDIAGPFIVSDLNSTLDGDLNGDENIDVLDVVLIVNAILNY